MNQRAGIGRYAREITSRLLSQADTDERIVCWYAPARSDADENARRLVATRASIRRSRISRTNVDRLGMRGRLPIWPLLGLGAADVAWSPDFTVPPVKGARRAITIHDVAWMSAPEYVPAGLRSFLERVVPRQIAAADAIVVVSESTRTAVLERFNVSSERVVVATNGIDHRFIDAGLAPDRSPLRGLNLPDNYLLMVGTIEPRKNHLRVIQALEKFRPDIPLVVAGGRGWEDESVLRAIANPAISSRIQNLGFVPEEMLPQLYANATGFIAASVEEGFDLPVLEAMATGTRLLVSDIPVHREIAGDLASHFDPGNVDSIGNGIIHLISGNEDRSAHAARQRAAAVRYSWDESASKVLKTLNALR